MECHLTPKCPHPSNSSNRWTVTNSEVWIHPLTLRDERRRGMSREGLESGECSEQQPPHQVFQPQNNLSAAFSNQMTLAINWSTIGPLRRKKDWTHWLELQMRRQNSTQPSKSSLKRWVCGNIGTTLSMRTLTSICACRKKSGVCPNFCPPMGVSLQAKLASLAATSSAMWV